MKSEKHFSFEKRAAEKAAARAKDERDIRSGVVSAAKLAHENGGGRRKIKLLGSSARMQKLASHY
ncbi:MULTISPECIES: hypothetical protein [unclassified Thioclava]|uniref:hypothetical protein n=1 Tax=unclassified Thioclava TaxID=2621713 RepID=UPI0011BA4D8C|nr:MULTISPECIES: hypothetical protein [unclassified Thioclava]|tara:strand:+ start:994 stop:1188 length:195 start_codon:yes stop_codon:yes gene_type:complete